MFVTFGASDRALTTAATAVWKRKLLSVSSSLCTSTLSVAGALKFACSSIRCALAASPDAVSESAICL
jgi:hypothetical protein